MKAKRRQREGPAALEILEEGIHLLRLAPLRAWSVYYVGSLPFILGVLYFWADMSRSAFAEERCAAAALGVSLLFLWLKACQAVFARELRARLGGGEPSLSLRSFLSMLWMQAAIQPTGLVALPVAALLALPFGWTYAFYQNLTALECRDEEGNRSWWRRAVRQSTVWPHQNHLLIAILGLLAVFVGLNLAIALVRLPQLLKTLLGIETEFSQSLGAMLSTTFLAAVAGLTYLCVDPLSKAVYVLRCFYGESVQTGEDLRTEFRALLRRTRPLATPLLLFLLALGRPEVSGSPRAQVPAEEARAEERSPLNLAPGGESGISIPELDRAIQEVISRPEYSWRLPRQRVAEEESPGAVAGFIRSTIKALERWIRTIKRWVEQVVKWAFEKLLRDAQRQAPSRQGTGWITSLQVLIFSLLALVLSATAILMWRLWKGRRKRTPVTAVRVESARPDLRDEEVGADRLPHQGWIDLAADLRARGELRLALRALYLAGLAHLAERELIRLAKFKSNLDYEWELKRRMPGESPLGSVFEQNRGTFDRVWYGAAEVTDELVDRFNVNLERITAC